MSGLATTDARSTLYPKITQHVSEVVKVLRKPRQESVLGVQGIHPVESMSLVASMPLIDSIPLIGSVKLHGTHADILVYNDDKIILQSRNVSSITIANDNSGFAAAMEDKTRAILAIRDQYLARWQSLNPHTELDVHHPVLIAGEWIGTGIQKDVAITQLSRRFVIISVAINNTWLRDAQYPDIEAPASAIYNVSRGGSFSATLYTADIPRTIAEVEIHAERVASSCPFASSFGVEGAGEGIVWKPAASQLNANPALWFKTKGGRFKPSFAPERRALPVGVQESRDAADAVAAIWCTEERLRQGWDYLGEVRVRRDTKALGRYLKWVQSDILIEEKGYIVENGVDEGMLRIGIAKVARAWYIRRVGLGED